MDPTLIAPSTTAPRTVDAAPTTVRVGHINASAADAAATAATKLRSYHARDKGVACQLYAENGVCCVSKCPYMHVTSETRRPVPQQLCAYYLRYRCLRDDCPFFHQTQERLDELIASGVTEYCPLDGVPVRNPLTPLSIDAPLLPAAELNGAREPDVQRAASETAQRIAAATPAISQAQPRLSVSVGITPNSPGLAFSTQGSLDPNAVKYVSPPFPTPSATSIQSADVRSSGGTQPQLVPRDGAGPYLIFPQPNPNWPPHTVLAPAPSFLHPGYHPHPLPMPDVPQMLIHQQQQPQQEMHTFYMVSPSHVPFQPPPQLQPMQHAQPAPLFFSVPTPPQYYVPGNLNLNSNMQQQVGVAPTAAAPGSPIFFVPP